MAERFTLLATVALLLLDDKNNVLLLKRTGTGWFDGYYSLVAGCVDGNETMRQALVREAYEEANIIIKPEWLTLGCVLHSHVPERRIIEAVDFFFICQKWENTIQNNEPHKHSELAFYPLTHLPGPLLPFMEAGLKQALANNCYAEFGWEK